MNGIGLVILLVSIALSVGLAFATHGHVLFLALPLVFGLPLARFVGRRRR